MIMIEAVAKLLQVATAMRAAYDNAAQETLTIKSENLPHIGNHSKYVDQIYHASNLRNIHQLPLLLFLFL